MSRKLRLLRPGRRQAAQVRYEATPVPQPLSIIVRERLLTAPSRLQAALRAPAPAAAPRLRAAWSTTVHGPGKHGETVRGLEACQQSPTPLVPDVDTFENEDDTRGGAAHMIRAVAHSENQRLCMLWSEFSAQLPMSPTAPWAQRMLRFWARQASGWWGLCARGAGFAIPVARSLLSLSPALRRRQRRGPPTPAPAPAPPERRTASLRSRAASRHAEHPCGARARVPSRSNEIFSAAAAVLNGKTYTCVDLVIDKYGTDITMGDYGDGFSRLTPDGDFHAKNISMLAPGQRRGGSAGGGERPTLLPSASAPRSRAAPSPTSARLHPPAPLTSPLFVSAAQLASRRRVSGRGERLAPRLHGRGGQLHGAPPPRPRRPGVSLFGGARRPS